MRIFLIEDDQEISERLVSGLEALGYVVDHADNGPDAYVIGKDENFDAVILDLGLPGMEGLEVLRRWRADGVQLPVLVLTARGMWSEKVEGLNAGADDYITKPFHIPEVDARLKALIRRNSGLATPVFTNGNVSLDTANGRVTLDGKPVDMTARELRMLNYFMHRLGRIIPQAELTEHLYTLDESRESNTIEVYVSRLRRKLGADIIKTVRGMGYRMDERK
ncbi:Transcriptional regulatory protein QseB [Candidatus Filomicrobium marinum]|uniref:Transcriptional regulatory protein QseB n=2 Tax=Filomicrobium TaxID=119044 RepID=A0A0D6JE52_9HYPH|nr:MULTISPECIES: response regulator transcription factor [Filomicrobium]CFX14368.1 Transcriptional regulatory protein QseB [Candidatus Filomicrobium marinum]CPR17780.1 Transcriptional regulatory protein QseB [Candidatus Filomicrobium marinum]SDO28117.1 DNA-binding response regulator, OmpR family, contains REC and winged-helix (wHTH) domain [Filomicrobium insigne]